MPTTLLHLYVLTLHRILVNMQKTREKFYSQLHCLRLQLEATRLSGKLQLYILAAKLLRMETLFALSMCRNSSATSEQSCFLSRRSVSDILKGHFLESAVFSLLLYGLEHCVMGIRDRRFLDGYFLRLAKRIMHMRFDYHLSFVEAEERLGVCRPSLRIAEDSHGGLDMCSGARTRYCAKFFTSLQVVVHEAADDRGAATTTPSSKTRQDKSIQ